MTGLAHNKLCFTSIFLNSTINNYILALPSDLKRRIQEHKSGGVKFTSKRLPVELIHYEAYQLESDARRREKFLKTTEGKRFLKQQLRDLLESLDST